MYLNRKAMGFDYMMGDLFAMVNDEFHFEEMIFDPKKYINLTNHTFSQIQMIGNRRPEVQKLVNRFHHRENYKFVNEVVYGKQSKKSHTKEELEKFKELFLQCQPESVDGRLTAENIIIGSSMFKYCEPGQFKQIKVKNFDGEIMTASELTNIMNIESYWEYQIHCYVKDRELYDLAKKTWSNFYEKYSHILKIE